MELVIVELQPEGDVCSCRTNKQLTDWLLCSGYVTQKMQTENIKNLFLPQPNQHKVMEACSSSASIMANANWFHVFLCLFLLLCLC